MTTPDNVLSVTYHDIPAGMVVVDDIVRSSDAIYDRLQEEVQTDDLHKAFVEASGLDWDEEQTKAAALAQLLESTDVPTDERPSIFEFIYSDTLEACHLLLIASAIRRARTADENKATLDKDQWTQAAVEDNEIGIEDDDPRGNWLEEAAAIDDPNEQRLYIGHVAAALLKTEALASPQMVSWRKHLITLHVHPKDDK
jgi:hypothetical protein